MTENASHTAEGADVTAVVEEIANPVSDGANVTEVMSGQRSDYRFSRQLVTLSDPGGIKAESIGALRAHMLAQHLRDGRRSLAICGPSANVGATYIATNLAVALATTGVKTLLIDANMRGSGVEEFIQPLTEKSGLAQFLIDPEPLLSDYIQDEVVPNLAVLFSGGVVENPQERLARGEFKALIDASMRDFDVTIIDSPPANESADARRIAAVARYAMIVSRRHESFVSDVQRLVDEMQSDRAKVIGSFLNDF